MWFEHILGLTFSYFDGRITIFKSTLDSLGNPNFYRFLYNKNDKHLAIQACDFGDPGSHKTPHIKDLDSFEIKSKDLVHLVYKDALWDKNFSYRLTGIYIESYNLVSFDLNKAIKLRKDKSND